MSPRRENSASISASQFSLLLMHRILLGVMLIMHSCKLIPPLLLLPITDVFSCCCCIDTDWKLLYAEQHLCAHTLSKPQLISTPLSNKILEPVTLRLWLVLFHLHWLVDICILFFLQGILSYQNFIALWVVSIKLFSWS